MVKNQFYKKRILETVDALHLVGTEAMNKAFAKNGKLNSNNRKSLDRRLTKKFTIVNKIELNGRIAYEVDGEYEHVDAGGRLKGSGKAPAPYIDDFKSLALIYMWKNKNVEPLSLLTHLSKMGVVTGKFVACTYDADIRKSNTKSLQKLWSNIKGYKPNEHDVDFVDNYVNNESNRLKRNYITFMEELQKLQVLNFKDIMYGKTTKNSKRPLTIKEIVSVDKLQRRFMKEFGIMKQDMYKSDCEKVIAYKEKFKNNLIRKHKLEYIFKAYKYEFTCDLESLERVAVDLGIIYEGGTLIKTLFKQTHSKHVLLLAEGRKSVNKSDKLRIKELKKKNLYVPMFEWSNVYFEFKPAVYVEEPSAPVKVVSAEDIQRFTIATYFTEVTEADYLQHLADMQDLEREISDAEGRTLTIDEVENIPQLAHEIEAIQREELYEVIRLDELYQAKAIAKVKAAWEVDMGYELSEEEVKRLLKIAN
ncbi:hypothetical protein [Bacillus sp. UNC41MFS5]|uniref:hypothetical protein n=1 Tax=Bacillus sp. UNC41MFS5 TaxID=1449046 RepID=UPI00047C3F05|nr:hypothetical protein [Bacillus sp. UNC41MFS5]